MLRSSESEEQRQKSRHLPILDYYETLQIEYIQAELRHKIYPKLKDKAFWAKVMEGKKQTIEKLSNRNNNLTNIFTDDVQLRIFQNKVYREKSYPLFTYRNEEHKQTQEGYDLMYYYLKGVDVRVQIFEDQVIGKVAENYQPFQSFVWVEIDKAKEKYPINDVTRIL